MMKKILFTTALFAILTSCTKEIRSIEDDSIHTFRISTVAPVLKTGDISSTKASIQANVSLKWNDGDQISVINLTTGKNMLGNLTASISEDKVIFEGELSGAVKSGDKLAAIYPCQNYSESMDVPDFTFDLSEQSCSSKENLTFAAYSVFECNAQDAIEVSADFIVPVSFNQISITGITSGKDIEWIDITNVGNAISFHVNKEQGSLDLTPSVGDVRVAPTAKSTGSKGECFVYCALAASPAASRKITIRDSLLYSSEWASSEMKTSKYYTSIATGFVVKDLLVDAPVTLDVDCDGDTLVFRLSSSNTVWTASALPSLQISPDSGTNCNHATITVVIPPNGLSARSFLLTFQGGLDQYQFTINQVANSQVYFRDKIFKTYMVENFDIDKDGEIDGEEATLVDTIVCNDLGIVDLTGIDNFPNLVFLDCTNNSITSLDVSSNNNLSTLKYDECSINPTGLKLGTYVVVAGIGGVVYESQNTDVRIISYDQKSCKWGEALAWCSQLGPQWRAPFLSDMQTVKNNLNTIQLAFGRVGAVPIYLLDPSAYYDTPISYWCASSTPSTTWANYFDFKYGTSGGTEYVRMVMPFRAVRSL